MRPLLRRSCAAVIWTLALLDCASGQLLIQSPAAAFETGGTEELLRDRSVREPVIPDAPAVQQESMLEVPLPARDLPVRETPVLRKNPLLLSARPIVLLLSLRASAMFDDNIFNSAQDKESDFIYKLAPGILAGMGDYAEQKHAFVTAGFVPSFINFQRHRDLSDIDYDAFLEGQSTFSKLRIDSRFSFERRTGEDLDAPGRISRDLCAADLLAQYALSERTTVEASGRAVHRDYLTLIDSDECFNRDFVAYLMSPTLQVALGAGLGWLSIANGQKQTYAQPLLRIWYQPGPKLSLRVIAGGDFRRFHEDQPGRTTPVGDISLVYQPSQGGNTKLTLGGYRTVQNSASLPGENYTSTGVIFRATQRVGRDLYLELEAGYQRASYYPAGPGIDSHRRDDNFVVSPRIRYDLNSWGSFSLFYRWRNNDSTLLSDTYENQHIGIEFTVGL